MIKKFFNQLLNFILPRSSDDRRLEKIGAADLLAEVPICRRDTEIAFAVFEYSNPLIKRLIWLLKFRADKAKAKIIAEVLFDHLIAFAEDKTLFENAGRFLIVPVPISSKRRRERGFNQCELIVNEIIRLDDGKDFDSGNFVSKIKEPGQQSLVSSRKKRLVLQKNCFAVTEPARVFGRHIILIDDVFTTGATLKEIKKTLLRAGAKKVSAFTFAH